MQTTDTVVAGDVICFAPLVRNFSRGLVIENHMHPFGQLLYASSGVVSVITRHGNFIIPPYRAMWLPPYCEHEVTMLTDTNITSLLLQNGAELELLDCRVIEMPPLMRALLVETLNFHKNQRNIKREQAILQLLRGEIASAQRVSCTVPMPAGEKLAVLCKEIMQDLSKTLSLAQLAEKAASTPKTIARQFQNELGMSYRHWLETIRFNYACAELERGTAAKIVAADLGYTASAFSNMMKRFQQRLQQERIKNTKDTIFADLPPFEWITRPAAEPQQENDRRWLEKARQHAAKV
ncbi:helix-turn-helix transcriptional regulator [Pseudochrobactrum sp. B5]|uniref:AraC family transcriptional regulator n=1 Tax=Pseudochrobactrum sp. B5 TaxID=1289478 RepID=UPI000AD3A0AF|nr:helix-turn-helix transcriptional regulator [Pseudochrobactrum sp. B5]